jgi:hypothetical protein
MYLGETSIPGLSEWQSRAVEAAIGGAPPTWHDNLLREIYQNVGDTPTSDFVLKAVLVSDGGRGDFSFAHRHQG